MTVSTMERFVNLETNASKTATVEITENASTSIVLRLPNDSVTANWVGLDLVAINVSFLYFQSHVYHADLFSLLGSPVKTTDIDFDLYTEKKLSDTFRLYWRILKEHKELEAVMVVNGTSYAALGWRPRSLTKSCKNFPQIGPVASPSSESASPEPKGEPKSEPEPNSEPEPSSEPEPKSEPEPTSEPEPSSEPEPTAEPGKTPDESANSRKSLYSRRSASPTPLIQTAPPQADVVETSISFKVSKKQGMNHFNSLQEINY